MEHRYVGREQISDVLNSIIPPAIDHSLVQSPYDIDYYHAVDDGEAVDEITIRDVSSQKPYGLSSRMITNTTLVTCQELLMYRDDDIVTLGAYTIEHPPIPKHAFMCIRSASGEEYTWLNEDEFNQLSPEVQQTAVDAMNWILSVQALETARADTE